MSISATHQSAISDLVQNQRKFFQSGRSRDIDFRIRQLKTLKSAIIDNEAEILEACRSDMNKPPMEAYTSERGMVLNEIDHAARNLKSWAKPRKAKTPLLHTRFFGLAQHFLASSYIYSEPYGVVLVIGPWNYPFQLTLSPLVGAIAAGNCTILKPSEIAPSSSGVIAKIVRDIFDPGFVAATEGDAGTGQKLLSEKFDYIFFTGGTRVGTIVMEAAAKQLTPVTLELGGKNPCIVDHDVHVGHTAKRIVWGKFFNAGQTCMTTDYLLVDRAIKKELLASIEATIKEFYGDAPSKSPDYGRIINAHHFTRLSRLLKEGEIVIGGETNPANLYIAPTVIDNVSPEHATMKEEIFGPILPVLEYEKLDDAISFVNERPKPVALFFFSRDKTKQEKVLRETSSGGGCINETFVHAINFSLPFGGVGASGIGKYHGKFSYDTFSNKKGVMKKSFLFDFALRYPPYGDKFRKSKRFL
ncbi:MAG: aldehyde dehydrogenase [Desulfobacterales bacterium]|jgi:aldehyde dehydrogenase (NAD+)|nr:aldehyde dehydrogenase [Desulfobacterales bacterium]